MKMKAENEYSGFFLAFEPLRTDRIAAELYTEREAAESFSASDWSFEKREVVFLSLDRDRDSINCAVLMERKHGSGGTGKLMMRMSEPVLIDSPIHGRELSKIVDLRRIFSTAESLSRIEVPLWQKIISAIKKLRPEIAEELDSLFEKRTIPFNLIGDSQIIMRLTEQRDALGLTLDIAKLDRSTVMRSMDVGNIGQANSVMDLINLDRLSKLQSTNTISHRKTDLALELLDNEMSQEQDRIRHDAEIFKDLFTDGMRHSSFKGSSGRAVRIHVYDKKPLETVIGIDLLIYQESYKSFLLLQYKTMQQMKFKNGRTWSYLVNSQIHEQIAAMNNASSTIKEQTAIAGTMMEWRLNAGCFYFKFCETTRLNDRDDSLIKGITLSAEHLENFLMLPDAIGDHGGCRVGYENCSRYLTNTQFVDLARHGWIGCDSRGYKFITEVLEANQEGGRIAMLAVVEGSGAANACDRKRYSDKRIIIDK